MTRKAMIKKMQYHEDKANELYDKIKIIEDKERLIGFKTKNDERMCTDDVYIRAIPLIRPFGESDK